MHILAIATHHHSEFSRLAHILKRAVVELQQIGIDFECHIATFAFLQEYAFKAFLVQVANHKSSEALPIQFYAYDKLTEDEKKNIERVAALIKEKYIPVANNDKFKPGYVVEKVQIRLELLRN